MLVLLVVLLAALLMLLYKVKSQPTIDFEDLIPQGGNYYRYK